jgi:AraC-like DNA-binding protein
MGISPEPLTGRAAFAHRNHPPMPAMRQYFSAIGKQSFKNCGYSDQAHFIRAFKKLYRGKS